MRRSGDEMKLLTVPAAAKLLGIPRSAAYELIQIGMIRAVRIPAGMGRAIRVPASEVDAFIDRLINKTTESDGVTP